MANRNAEAHTAQAQKQFYSTQEAVTLAEPKVRICTVHSAHDDEKDRDVKD